MPHVFRIYQGKTIFTIIFNIKVNLNTIHYQFCMRFRSTLLPATEQKEMNEIEEPLGTSPPLELRRTVAGQRVAVPHSLQSPQDRATGECPLFILSNDVHI